MHYENGEGREMLNIMRGKYRFNKLILCLGLIILSIASPLRAEEADSILMQKWQLITTSENPILVQSMMLRQGSLSCFLNKLEIT
jgi:hypothetical protein